MESKWQLVKNKKEILKEIKIYAEKHPNFDVTTFTWICYVGNCDENGNTQFGDRYRVTVHLGADEYLPDGRRVDGKFLTWKEIYIPFRINDEETEWHNNAYTNRISYQSYRATIELHEYLVEKLGVERVKWLKYLTENDWVCYD